MAGNERRARAAPSVSTIRREQKTVHATLAKRQEPFEAGYALGASQTLQWCLGLLTVKPSQMLQALKGMKKRNSEGAK